MYAHACKDFTTLSIKLIASQLYHKHANTRAHAKVNLKVSERGSQSQYSSSVSLKQRVWGTVSQKLYIQIVMSIVWFLNKPKSKIQQEKLYTCRLCSQLGFLKVEINLKCLAIASQLSYIQLAIIEAQGVVGGTPVVLQLVQNQWHLVMQELARQLASQLAIAKQIMCFSAQLYSQLVKFIISIANYNMVAVACFVCPEATRMEHGGLQPLAIYNHSHC